MNDLNLSIYQGDTYTLQINAQDSSNSTLVLSGYFVRGYVRNDYSVTGYTSFSGSVISAVSGIAQIDLTAQQTTGLKPGISVYDIEAYTTGISGVEGLVTKIARGYAYIYPQVTF